LKLGREIVTKLFVMSGVLANGGNRATQTALFETAADSPSDFQQVSILCWKHDEGMVDGKRVGTGLPLRK